MRRLSHITCTGLVMMAFVLPAAAQDKAKTEKKGEPLKTEKAVPKQSEDSVKDSIDLDSFFKKGEENAKNGGSCNKPAEPADPIA